MINKFMKNKIDPTQLTKKCKATSFDIIKKNMIPLDIRNDIDREESNDLSFNDDSFEFEAFSHSNSFKSIRMEEESGSESSSGSKEGYNAKIIIENRSQAIASRSNHERGR